MKMEEKEARCIYRRPPCLSCDIEGLESWLSDRAAAGWHLEKDGFFCGFAAFSKGEPKQVRYRLEAAEKRTGWLGDDEKPEEEALALSEAYGWTYVAAFSDFHIYRSEGLEERELNTDPAVQALALKKVQRRQWWELFDGLLWMVVYPALILRGRFLLAMIGLQSWFCLLGAGLLSWHLALNVRKYLHLRRLRRRLLYGEGIDHRKNWKEKAARHHILGIAHGLLLVVWCVMLLSRWSDSVLKEGQIPLAEYGGDPPFATLADFVPGGSGYRLANYSFGNTVSEWSDWIAPYNMDWGEIASIDRADGTTVEGSYYVYYHEMACPLLARIVAWEYQQADKGEHYEELDLPDFGLDHAVAYMNRHHILTVVLQQGDCVLHATFTQSGVEIPLTLAEWTEILADSIRHSK